MAPETLDPIVQIVRDHKDYIWLHQEECARAHGGGGGVCVCVAGGDEYIKVQLYRRL